MTKPMRINARLTPELSEALAELRRRSGKSTTEIIVAALRNYSRGASSAQQNPTSILQKLEAAGLVGSIHGSHGLSSTYKDAFGASVKKKVSRR